MRDANRQRAVAAAVMSRWVTSAVYARRAYVQRVAACPPGNKTFSASMPSAVSRSRYSVRVLVTGSMRCGIIRVALRACAARRACAVRVVKAAACTARVANVTPYASGTLRVYVARYHARARGVRAALQASQGKRAETPAQRQKRWCASVHIFSFCQLHNQRVEQRRRSLTIFVACR